MSVVGVFVWNWLLRRLVARRSRELLKSQVAKAESDLRVGERTRLAAELHDAISQTLTGVSFQIDAAADTLGSDLPTAARFLAVARQTLLSCREELRRCLWDLRNDSLEGSDYAETLRRAIRPGIGAAKLTVRFDARRSKMSDSTAHAVLCIVRELCVNAVRHGGARSIQVAGAVESRNIRLSVRDDGRGFDPSKCPGPAEGHFGLQGIRERVARLGGRMTIESSEGKGASVIIEVRNETDKHTAG
jgi:signal transduction histidine kinase